MEAGVYVNLKEHILDILQKYSSTVQTLSIALSTKNNEEPPKDVIAPLFQSICDLNTRLKEHVQTGIYYQYIFLKTTTTRNNNKIQIIILFPIIMKSSDSSIPISETDCPRK